MNFMSTNLIRSSTIKQALCLAQTNRLINMKVIPVASTTKAETFEERNARLGRELSPHLTIYKPQLTSMLSITHRATGMALTAAVWGLGLAALTSPQDVSSYVSIVEGLHLSASTLFILKFVLAYPLSYHTMNGIRHLLWDSGRFLKIKEVYSTGYAMVGLSFALAAVLAML